MPEQEPNPIIMSFNGTDPRGGFGIQADIETLASIGCHCTPIITSVTIPGNDNQLPIDTQMLRQQALSILEDFNISAFKVGMIGSCKNVAVIKEIIEQNPEIPVVIDPMMHTNGKVSNIDLELAQQIREQLLTTATILVASNEEARVLAPETDSIEASAMQLLNNGCEYLLISGSHESTPAIINMIYGESEFLNSYSWDRLPYHYHGAGCTLSAAIAGMLGHYLEPLAAMEEAQEYTYLTLRQAIDLGNGQFIPNHFFSGAEEAHESNRELN